MIDAELRDYGLVLWTIKKYRLLVVPLPIGDGKTKWAVGTPNDDDWFSMWSPDELVIDGHFQPSTGDTLYDAVMAWRAAHPELDDLAEVRNLSG